MWWIPSSRNHVFKTMITVFSNPTPIGTSVALQGCYSSVFARENTRMMRRGSFGNCIKSYFPYQVVSIRTGSTSQKFQSDLRLALRTHRSRLSWVIVWPWVLKSQTLVGNFNVAERELVAVWSSARMFINIFVVRKAFPALIVSRWSEIRISRNDFD
jgi:hypothetical protein